MSNTVPEGWTRVKFLEVADVVKGLTYSTADYASKDTGHPFITLKCIGKNGGFSPRGMKYYSGKYKPSQVVVDGDVVFANTDLTRDGDVVGSPVLVPEIHSKKPSLISMDLSRVVPKKGHDSRYIYYWLQRTDVKRQMINLSAGSTVLHLNTRDVPYLRVDVPPLPEQRKIAAILSSVDEVIEKSRAQIDKLKDLKTGMMQELLTKGIGHTEFKDSPVGRIPSNWKYQYLSSVVDEIVDCEHKTAPYVDKSDYLVVRTSNVREGSLILEDIKCTTQEAFLEWTSRATPKNGDILFTREAPAGESCIVPPGVKLCMGQRMVLIRPSKQTVLPDFLSLYLTSDIAKREIYGLSIGTTVTRINIEDIRKIPCAIPPIIEQRQIAESIGAATQALQEKSKRLRSFEVVKQALMQDLLTGNVRVNLKQKETAAA